MKKRLAISGIGLSIAALLTATPTSAQTVPQVRLFELQTAADQRQRFTEVGQDNMSISIREESGTLTMFALRRKDDPDFNYVFEIYRDEAAYKTHAASRQFQRFVEAAKTMISGRKVLETDPRFLFERQALHVTQGSSKPTVRLAEVTVKAHHDTDFARVVLDEMRQSAEKEEGVLAMYAFTLKDQPLNWRFVEVYADDAAYHAHRQTSHFQSYLKQSADWTIAKDIHELEILSLQSKGSLDSPRTIAEIP